MIKWKYYENLPIRQSPNHAFFPGKLFFFSTPPHICLMASSDTGMATSSNAAQVHIVVTRGDGGNRGIRSQYAVPAGYFMPTYITRLRAQLLWSITSFLLPERRILAYLSAIYPIVPNWSIHPEPPDTFSRGWYAGASSLSRPKFPNKNTIYTLRSSPCELERHTYSIFTRPIDCEVIILRRNHWKVGYSIIPSWIASHIIIRSERGCACHR